MEDDPLYRDPDIARFYDLENGWREDLAFCTGLAEGCGSVLDLGCGTGRLAARLAADGRRDVAGVDPAPAMLEIARTRPGGERVSWTCEDARTVRLGRRFDLVVLTGHAFQVFLTGGDRRDILATIAAHLAPGARFVFDTRNPACREWEEWTPERSRETLRHESLGDIVVWNDFERDDATGIVTYGTHYEVPAEGRTYSARSRIAFPSREEVAALMDETGLEVESWLGSWDGSPWHADAREIIVLGRPA